jgi:F0F1-type ATP synthase assembly protein I
MKLLPSPTSVRRTMRGDDAVGQGMDAAFTLALFLGLGFLVDRWLGTTPLFMIVLFLVVAVALFLSWKARYTASMEVLEAQRRDDATRHRPRAAEGSTIDP